jgi:omega-6 fatty acid desaturase (delta-12 desaturase)
MSSSSQGASWQESLSRYARPRLYRSLLDVATSVVPYLHVHHLNARIPNYNLQAAHDNNPILHDVPTLSLWDGLRAVRLKLWDEHSGKLVTFAQARGSGRSPSAPLPAGPRFSNTSL